ncbi:hypothetical protein G9272_32095 [Streptomyces asoensis]|uniref:Uncharacterized protein n=1 Tax=Streptomyces asoensis TaxID=249586 RepID=A0A6M4WV13_9ACTN|nr:hypothetical protein [Streptomyces asoensis]QJT04360.1 hypothetical protein G9272_32095 [Streptomyces asoensis]
MTNSYRVEAPVRSYSGDSVGVQFTKGTGYVNDASKEGRAAIEYFRRQGYALLPIEDGEEVPASTGPASPEDAMTNLGHGSAPSVGLGIGIPDEQPPVTATAAPEYDPSKYNQDDVLAYLDRTDDAAERQRVIDAEADGKKRKAILARGEQNQEDQK